MEGCQNLLTSWSNGGECYMCKDVQGLGVCFFVWATFQFSDDLSWLSFPSASCFSHHRLHGKVHVGRRVFVGAKPRGWTRFLR
jgi:hypothetical protein